MNIIYVTCKNINEAKGIALLLIKRKLAVCCNIFPCTYSIYRWENKIEETEETVLLIKTNFLSLKKAMRLIKKSHSYKNPDIISWNIDKTTSETKKWFIKEIGK